MNDQTQPNETEGMGAASALSAGLGAWISTEHSLPDDETPVLIFRNGNIVIGERRWERPGFEDAFEAYWYWDDPSDDGQDWGRDKVTHWMPLPEAPNVELTGASRNGEASSPKGEVERPVRRYAQQTEGPTWT